MAFKTSLPFIFHMMHLLYCKGTAWGGRGIDFICKYAIMILFDDFKTRGSSMLKITVCIGSSCHIKGSRQVVTSLQALISKNGLGDKVELGSTFCMGKCQMGVCVSLDDKIFSVTPETAETFFREEILPLAK